MDMTCLLFGIIFTIAGIVFALGKAHIHLTVWKQMSQEEKNQINIVPLCRNVGEIIALSGIIFLLKGLCPAFTKKFFVLSMVAWMLLTAFDVWYISTSKRFRNQ